MADVQGPASGVDPFAGLSGDLEGLEADNLNFYLGLPVARRDALLSAYEDRFGRAGRLWLQRASQASPNQRPAVSRTVTARLFELMPEYLDASDRLALARTAWRHLRARSEAVLWIPPHWHDPDAVFKKIAAHFINLIPGASALPEVLRARFDWLTEPDLEAMEAMLRALLEAERDALLERIREQVTVLFAERPGRLEAMTSRLEIAGHRLDVTVDAAVDELHLQFIQEEPPPPPVKVGGAFYSTLIGLGFGMAAAVGLWLWLSLGR